MDLSNLTSQSPKILAVLNEVKNNPEFFNELRTDPKAALDKMGIELNEEELNLLVKLENFQDLGTEAKGFFMKIKTWLGFNEPH